MPTSDTDFSCAAELDGIIVAMGILDVQDGMGQPRMPQRAEGVVGYIVKPDFAVLGREWRAVHSREAHRS